MMLERLEEIAANARENDAQYQHTVRVCTAAGCLSSQSDIVKESFDKEVTRSGLERWCQVKGVGCLGLCSKGPLVAVDSKTPDSAETHTNTLYEKITPDDVTEIVDALDSEPIERLKVDTDIPFFEKQLNIVLENSGIIDPERIDEYIANNGYLALTAALTELEPIDVIDDVVASGLRGRGGGGYPAGL